MQLRPMCLAVFVAALLQAVPAGAQAPSDSESLAAANVRVYADDDHMTVVSPAAGAQAPLGDWLLDVNAAVDALSGASVDVVTEASPTPIREARVELGFGASYRLSQTASMRARITGSREPDYLSLSLEVGAVIELAQRNTILDVSYAISADRVGSTTNDAFDKPRTLNRLTTTLTQILDRNTYLDLTAEVVRRAGYLASPYRTVLLVDPMSSSLTRAPEQTPRRRWSGAGRVRVRRALGSWFAHVDYRHYRDRWSISSHTGNMRLIKPVSERLSVAGHLRGYVQSAADFYRVEYQLGEAGEIPQLRSRERRLGRMRTVFGSIAADAAPTSNTQRRVIVALTAMRFYFLDYRPQSQRDAITFSVGFRSPL